jgi:protein TonB
VATLFCKVGGDGGLFDCTVTSEAPAGWGFGAAALKMAPLFKMTATVNGESVAGATVTVPLTFRLN